MTGKQFLYITVATFITIVAWVVVDIIHSRSNVQPPPEVQQLLEPLNPNFDQEVINSL